MDPHTQRREEDTRSPKREVGLGLFVCSAIILFALQIFVVLSLITGLFLLLT